MTALSDTPSKPKSPAKAPGRKGREQKKPEPPGPRDEADLFISEVTEELQRERAYKLFRRYGPFAAAAIILVVLAAAVNEYLKGAATQAARDAGGVLVSVQQVSDDNAVRAERFAAAADGELEGGPAMIASFYAGSLRALSEQDETAAADFDAAAERAVDFPIYADLARIRSALLRFDTAEPDALISALTPLAAPERPFRALALELIGLAEIKAGRTAEGRARLQEALGAAGATEEQRLRLRRLIEGAGGAASQAG